MSVIPLPIWNSIRVFNAAGYIALGYLERLGTTLPAFKICGDCPTVAFKPSLLGRSQLSFQINVGLAEGYLAIAHLAACDSGAGAALQDRLDALTAAGTEDAMFLRDQLVTARRIFAP